MLDPGIWTDEVLAKCTHTERLLYIGLKSNADDEGRLKGDCNFLKATIFPYDSLNVTIIASGVKRLAKERLIIHYKSGEKDYIQLPDWKQDQYIRMPRPSLMPPPEGYTPTPTPMPTPMPTRMSTPLTPNRIEQNRKEGKKVACPDCEGVGEIGNAGYQRACPTCKGRRLIWREDYELLRKTP